MSINATFSNIFKSKNIVCKSEVDIMHLKYIYIYTLCMIEKKYSRALTISVKNSVHDNLSLPWHVIRW